MGKSDFTITVVEYYKLLGSHDWYYEYSDDYQVWKRGSESLKHLRELSSSSPEHKALFDAFSVGERPECPNVETEPLFNLRNLMALVADGSFFTVEFVKRTTGELRKMNCRIGVRKHLKGGKASYSAANKGLLRVYDIQAKGYRSIPLEGIRSLCVGGQTFNL